MIVAKDTISLHNCGMTGGGCPTLSAVGKRWEIPGLMPRKLKRHHGRGDLHFITFSCYERRALLGTVRARDVFLKTLEQVRRRFASSVVGYVAMPEHVHKLRPPKPFAASGICYGVAWVGKALVAVWVNSKRTSQSLGTL